MRTRYLYEWFDKSWESPPFQIFVDNKNGQIDAHLAICTLLCRHGYKRAITPCQAKYRTICLKRQLLRNAGGDETSALALAPMLSAPAPKTLVPYFEASC
jgi:hypothetical protein